MSDLPLDLLLQLGDDHQVPRLAALQAVLSHEVLGLLEVGTQDRVEDEIGNLKFEHLHQSFLKFMTKTYLNLHCLGQC